MSKQHQSTKMYATKKSAAQTVAALAKPVKWSVAVPGSKSLMNRALICAALARGRSVLTNAVWCDDTNYMVSALQALGVHITKQGQTVIVHGCGGQFHPKRRQIFVGNAGTVMRFLTPLVPSHVTLVGDERMRQRPINDLIKAVAALQTKSTITVTGNVSSQFISALLLYAPTLGRTITVTVSDTIVSAPYIRLTIQVMQQFGVQVQQHGRRFTIRPQLYQSARYTIEGDASSATYWWALAAVTRSHVTVTNVAADTLQPDIRFLAIMRRMGCLVSGTTVVGPWNKPLKPVRLAMADCPDAVMSVAVVAALAEGKSIISRIHHLAGKESNRLQALQLNLRRLGISARANQTALTITGRSQALWADTIKTHNDHRLAMAFAVLGLACGGVRIDQPACVAKSYPTFWQDVRRAQQQARQQHLLLTGLRGVGKTTFGRALARQQRCRFIDLDQAIEQRVCQPIAQFVAKHDWPTFRKVEHEALQAALKTSIKKTGAVIATGGGTLVYSRNQRLVKSQYVVLLIAPLPVVTQRLSTQSHRPTLLAGSRSVTSELRQLWKQRQPEYYQVADAVCRV